MLDPSKSARGPELWSVGRAYLKLSSTLEAFSAADVLALHSELAELLGVDKQCCLRLTVLGGSIIFQECCRLPKIFVCQLPCGFDI